MLPKSLRFLRLWFNTHPLATVMVIAVAVRLVAVIFSKGFIHSDDHYDTIATAWDWIANGMTGDDGYLRWKGDNPSHKVGRFPLYVLTQWGIIKSMMAMGVTSLDSIMYVVRALHAAVSLIPVWVGFAITRMVTRSDRWAVAAGLVMALHFALPFLGVRNLIEVVGGNIWMLAIYYLYRWETRRQVTSLYTAGILTGLAWMIRFQIAFAVLPVPFVLWWRDRSLKSAVHYSAGVTIMLLVSGLADWLVLGRFASSTIRNLTMNAGLDAMYDTMPLMYLAVVLVLLIPPTSVVAIWLWMRRSFWSRHTLLMVSFLSFFVFHSLHVNQQERFLFPILPHILLMTVLAIYHKIEHDGHLFRNTAVTRIAAGWAISVNLLLLAFLTPAYGHKGLIEPIMALGHMEPKPRVLIVQPEIRRWTPDSYAGPGLSRHNIRDWKYLDSSYIDNPRFDYVLMYPVPPSAHQAYVDSVEKILGPVRLAWHVKPSAYDWLLYHLNPRHNRSYEAWIYRPLSSSETGQ